MEQVHRVLDVAIAVVSIDQHRQIARADHVAESGGEFAELAEPDVGQSVARPRGLEAADEEALEAGLLDEQGGQRVVRAGQDERLFRLRELAYGW